MIDDSDDDVEDQEKTLFMENGIAKSLKKEIFREDYEGDAETGT